MNNRFSGKNVVITGGSSGIGLEIAVEFAKLGANLILLARDSKKLEEAKTILQSRVSPSVSVVVHSVDVADKAALTSLIRRIGEGPGGIYVLINNAGMILCGLLENHPLENLERVLNTNYLGMLYAYKAAWPYIKKAKGHIGFVSSVAGYVGLIGYGSYSPSKFAIIGLAECLRMEAKDHGVGVTLLYPPDTYTPQLEYERAHTLPECLALSKNSGVLKSDLVARQFVRGILKNKFEIFCNLESRFVRLIRVLIPGLYFNIVDGIIRSDRKKRGVA